MYPFDNQKSRIHLHSTIPDIFMSMSDGNIGSVAVMNKLMRSSEAIDPDSLLGGVGNILSLDSHRIYGPRIWQLYKDVAGEDIRVTIALLRAVQLGYLSDDDLQHAIDNMGEGIDIPALVIQVEERLPSFQRAPVVTE